MEEGKLRVFAYVEGVFPKQAHQGDAGFDLTAAKPPNIVGLEDPAQKGFYYKIDYIEYDTGVRLSPPKEIFSTVFPRSSVSKKNLVLANSIGLIDTGYRDTIKLRFKYVAQPWDLVSSIDGEIMTTIDKDKIYQKGDRIGQLVFFTHTPVSLEQITDKDLMETSIRGLGGFGSTGH